jgi:hypothetical protein
MAISHALIFPLGLGGKSDPEHHKYLRKKPRQSIFLHMHERSCIICLDYLSFDFAVFEPKGALNPGSVISGRYNETLFD